MILCSGCFDGLHAGQVRYLQKARALDVTLPLLVAVASDAYIQQMKGRMPHWSLADRMQTVAALKGVDDVIVHGWPSVADMIREHRPRWFVKGAEWRYRLPPDVRLACEAVQAEIVFTETPGRHTSEVDVRR